MSALLRAHRGAYGHDHPLGQAVARGAAHGFGWALGRAVALGIGLGGMLAVLALVGLLAWATRRNGARLRALVEDRA